MAGPSAERITEWEGGSLSELVTMLQSAALPVRIEVIAPGASNSAAGELHLLAGGLSDAFAGSLRRDDAMAALQRLEGARFMVECRLPNAETGSLSEPGPSTGSLKDRPVAALMRYCEDYVLTCRLEVWRGDERAIISYRRGEIITTTVGGADGSERLPDVMGWTDGLYGIILPEPVLPHIPGRTRESSISRSAERKRHTTLPMASATEAKEPTAEAKPDAKVTKTQGAPAAEAKALPATAPAATMRAPQKPATVVPTPATRAPLATQMTMRGTPAAPSVPTQPTQARPTQSPRVQPTPTAAQTNAPAPIQVPQARPVAPAAKPTPVASPQISAKPAPAVQAARPAMPAAATAQPAPAKTPATAAPAPAASAAPVAQASAASTATRPKAATPAAGATNELPPASGTIEAKPKHATNLPPSAAPIQVAEQPDKTPVASPSKRSTPPAESTTRSKSRRQQELSRKTAVTPPVRAYVFVGLAIGLGVVLAYWLYWYLPFGH